MRKIFLLAALVFNFSAATSFAMGAKKPSQSPAQRPVGYEYVDPNNVVPAKALQLALKGFDERRKGLPNTNYLTVIDYTLHSKNKRFFLINMRTGAVEAHVVAHGSGSDSNHDGYAEKFSNVSGSNATSVGFFETRHTYQGSNGYSLVLAGLSSTNSRAQSRAIVIHAAAYVKEGNSKQGRSWGCPALPENVNRSVVDRIKNGSLIFAYHQSHF